MIDVKEHIYHDDPKVGHPDVKTRLKDGYYFFLGNGLIQAAIQVAPSNDGSPLGLIIMNPEQLGKKREALTFDPENGFSNTMIRFLEDGNSNEIRPAKIVDKWCDEYDFPAVKIQWSTDRIHVSEIFYCADPSSAQLIREVHVENRLDVPIKLRMITGVHQKIVEKAMSLNPAGENHTFLVYTLTSERNGLDIHLIPKAPSSDRYTQIWQKSAKFTFGHPLLNHYFNASRFQLPAVISRCGRTDASIWQYNREWVRDQAFMAVGLTLSGHHETAGMLLNRLLDEFVTDEGDTIDSGERRDPDEVELDQNGTLIYALKNYALWTGDFTLMKKNWNTIKKTIEYPFKDCFRHEPSGLFCNCREYWERHRVFGIDKGIELMYQVFPSIGLSCAATLARLISQDQDAAEWDHKAERLKTTLLHDPVYRLVDERGLIKRRSVDGSIQETITPLKESGLPDGVPLTADIPHHLNPDTSTALPIALGFVPPESPVARTTMDHLEHLWNQGWKGGGHGRYNMTSEADSEGPWPFASLIVARAGVEMGDFDNVWRTLEWMITIPGDISGSWFEMYGPRISPPYAQVGITPWTWAEMIILLIHHILGIQPEE